MIKFLKSLFYSTPEENYDPMKYLIVGLGNIGSDYAGTRHNIGFDVVNMMAKDADVSWKQETLGDVAEVKHKGRTLVLLKPSTYMNKSGKALKYWMEKKKIPVDNVLAVVDELQLEALRSPRDGVARWRWSPGFFAGKVALAIQDGPLRSGFEIIVDPARHKLTRDHFNLMIEQILEDTFLLCSQK